MIKNKGTAGILTILIAYIIGQWEWVKHILFSFSYFARAIIIFVVLSVLTLAFVWVFWPEKIMSLI